MTETPSNGNFLFAAYVAAAGIYCGYAVLLWRRAKTAIGARSLESGV